MMTLLVQLWMLKKEGAFTLFSFLVTPHSIQDPTSPTRDRSCAPCSGGCFINYTKSFDYGSQKTVENSSRDGNTRPPTCLLRNLCAGQEATVRTGHGHGVSAVPVGEGERR